MAFWRGLVAASRQRRFNLVHVILAVIVVSAATFLAGRLENEYQLRRLRTVAFASPLPEVHVEIDPSLIRPETYRGQYDFTSDWFSHNLPVWRRVMEPYRGRPAVHFLEIGVYEGRSLIWMLENILTHETACATGLDIFEGPYKERYFANIERSGAADKVTTISGYSQVALRSLPLESFDIIYVDGSHGKSDVLEDAVLSWRLLKAGGILIFDDYRWFGLDAADADADPTEFAKPAIDAFLQCFEGQYDVLHNSYQMIVKKR
jgi:SAM-dependent methyltransferase